MQQLIGHPHIKMFFSHLLATQRIPQVLLFYGPQGVGKRYFAYAFARALLATSKQHSPDIRVYALDEGQTSHSLASIRRLKEEVYLPPFEAKYKVVIIEDAHKMLPASANALLKTLEEPSPECKIILLAESLSDVLPTIVSRCCKVPFSLLPTEEIKKFLLQRQLVDAKQAEVFAQEAWGSLDNALLLAEGKTGHQVLCDVVLKFKTLAHKERQEKLTYLEELAESSPSHSKQAIYEAVLRLMRDIMVIQYALDPSLLFFKNQESLLKSAAEQIHLSPQSLQKLWQQAYDSLLCHVKLKVGLEHLLVRLYA